MSPQNQSAARTHFSIPRFAFLDNLRYWMILLVLVHHSVGAYATVAPHWLIHDSTSFAADIIRELFDLFMMPACCPSLTLIGIREEPVL